MEDRLEIPGGNEFHPDAVHFGKVVWISDDGNTVAYKCKKKHNHKTTVFMMQANTDK